MTLLTFSSEIEAADQERRIISGIVVPFGKIGHTSVGEVVFEAGSIQIDDTKKIKLLAQHDPTNPIGRAQSFQHSSTEIRGQFKISASAKGTDYLILASEDLIGGLSVGVDVISSKPGKNGVLYVQKAVLKEVSLVESPAFKDAVVTKVAASESDADVPSDTPTESEATVSTTDTPAATPEATPAAPVEAAPAVEASRPTVKAAAPYTSQTVRHGITSMGRYTEHKIKASLGNDESRLWIAASEDPKNYLTAANDSFTTNPAFNPIQYLKEFVDNTNFGRPAIDAVSKGVLPATGMTFQVPKLTTAPTVAETAEGAAPAATQMVSAYLTGTVKKYSGMNTFSLELLERSDPIFYDELAIQLQRAYLKATDSALIAALVAGGTQAAITTADSAGIISFVSTEAPAAYSATSFFAKNVVAGVGFWTLLLGAVDTTGRPIYNAANPMNNAGDSAPTSIKGNVLGLDLYVDHLAVATVIDDCAFIIAPETVSWYESAATWFSVNLVGTGEIQTSINGYGASLVKQGAGIRRFNIA